MADMTGVISTLQQQNAVLTQQLKTMQAGIAVNPFPAIYTVAALPTSGASGQWAFASNGRKPGEGGGSGTGVPVFWNAATSTWFSYCSGAAVVS